MELHPSRRIFSISFFMLLPPDLLCDDTNNFPWDAIHNLLSFIDTPKCIHLITKIYSLLTNWGKLESQVSELLKMDIGEHNIRGSNNTMHLVVFLKDCMDSVIKLIDFLGYKVG